MTSGTGLMPYWSLPKPCRTTPLIRGIADVTAQESSSEEAPSTKRQRRSPPANIANLRDTIQRAVSEWDDRMPDFPAARVPPIAEFNPSVHIAMTRIIAQRDAVEANLVTLHDLDSVSPLRNYDEEYA